MLDSDSLDPSERTSSSSRPTPMRQKLKNARKLVPISRVLRATAMLWATGLLKWGGWAAKWATSRRETAQATTANNALVTAPAR